MHYTPKLSEDVIPDGLDLVTCWVCKTTQVRDRFEQLVMGAAIRKAWAALVNDIADPE